MTKTIFWPLLWIISNFDACIRMNYLNFILVRPKNSTTLLFFSVYSYYQTYVEPCENAPQFGNTNQRLWKKCQSLEKNGTSWYYCWVFQIFVRQYHKVSTFWPDISLFSCVDIWRTNYQPPFVNIVFGCPLYQEYCISK